MSFYVSLVEQLCESGDLFFTYKIGHAHYFYWNSFILTLKKKKEIYLSCRAESRTRLWVGSHSAAGSPRSGGCWTSHRRGDGSCRDWLNPVPSRACGDSTAWQRAGWVQQSAESHTALSASDFLLLSNKNQSYRAKNCFIWKPIINVGSS